MLLTQNNMIEKELQEYALAFQEHLDNQKAESEVKLNLQRSRYRLNQAKTALRAKEADLLDSTIKID